MTSTAKPDVIVVGSGIIGIACAHYLSATGLRVTVIDQGTIGGACSHGNCGYICPSHVLPLTEPGAIGTALKSLFNPQAPFRVKLRLSPALVKWMWQFATDPQVIRTVSSMVLGRGVPSRPTIVSTRRDSASVR